MELLISCLYAFAACLGFSLVFNIHGSRMLYAALGGALGWLVYLSLAPFGGDLLQSFFAALTVSAYSEIMARLIKAPVTGFLLVAILPLVPGGGIYYTMEYFIAGQSDAFIRTGLHTFALAGIIAVGVLLVSSSVRMLQTARTHRNRER